MRKPYFIIAQTVLTAGSICFALISIAYWLGVLAWGAGISLIYGCFVVVVNSFLSSYIVLSRMCRETKVHRLTLLLAIFVKGINLGILVWFGVAVLELSPPELVLGSFVGLLFFVLGCLRLEKKKSRVHGDGVL